MLEKFAIFGNVQPQLQPHLVAADPHRLTMLKWPMSAAAFRMWFCTGFRCYRRERAAAYGKLLKLRDTDGFRKHFQ